MIVSDAESPVALSSTAAAIGDVRAARRVVWPTGSNDDDDAHSFCLIYCVCRAIASRSPVPRSFHAPVCGDVGDGRTGRPRPLTAVMAFSTFFIPSRRRSSRPRSRHPRQRAPGFPVDVAGWMTVQLSLRPDARNDLGRVNERRERDAVYHHLSSSTKNLLLVNWSNSFSSLQCESKKLPGSWIRALFEPWYNILDKLSLIKTLHK